MSAERFVGLDIGISTTDVVADWARERPVSLPTDGFVKTAEAVLAILFERVPPPDDRPVVVAATGVGANRLPESLGGCRVRQVPEIEAIGRGGLRVGEVAEALVVSLGTGTALVSARDGNFQHIVPGSGVGGGTLVAFARALCGVPGLAALADLARQGDRSRVDLTIGEVVGGPLGALPATATASNLGKWSPQAGREDLAAALVNLITEVALSVTLLGLQLTGQSRAVLVGRLPLFGPIGEQLRSLPPGLRELLILPREGAMATALGALESLSRERPA